MESHLTFVSPPGACEYLPDRIWQLQYAVEPLTPAKYMTRLQQGWRRFGHVVFRPVCPACRMCRSLRVPVAAFRPNQSQRRAWKANQSEVTISIGSPTVSDEKRELYLKFHEYQRAAKGWPAPGADDIESFVDHPFPTEEWCYAVGDRLIAVGYVDVLAEGLSAMYFYYDPDERNRSIGTFNVLALIAAARALELPHVYLGYYVEGCPSLAYKGGFRPNEVLRPDGRWEPFLQRGSAGDSVAFWYDAPAF